MKLSDLEGKIIIRTAPRKFKNTRYAIMSGEVLTYEQIDASYTLNIYQCLKITSQLAYLVLLKHFGQKEELGKVVVFSREQYDDNNWEEVPKEFLDYLVKDREFWMIPKESLNEK